MPAKPVRGCVSPTQEQTQLVGFIDSIVTFRHLFVGRVNTGIIIK